MTTPRWLLSLLCTRPELRPGRALLTPTWLAALAVLGVNDHLLKGAGLLPGALTGKLSDVAGMLVAPALLAALLGLRSRRGLLMAHLAVAAVFAAIKLSPAAADAWSWLMGLVGVPWHITVDPTDLLALPALAIGWRALLPAMRRPLPFHQRLAPRLAQVAAVCVGTTLCVATSSNNPGPGEEEIGDVGDEADWGDEGTTDVEYAEIQADVYLSNNTPQDVVVRTRDLLADVQIDCVAVEEDPGLLLAEPLFGAGRTWTMPPGTNAAVRDIDGTPARECYAVRVEGDALVEPFVLFWRASDIPVETVVGDIDDPSEHRPGAVILAADADGRLSVGESLREVVFAIDLLPPADAFYPGPDGERIAWSDPPTSAKPLQITTLDAGPDGCLGLDFDGGADFPRWYLCLPEGAFPFAQDQWVVVETFASGNVVQVTAAADPEGDPVPDVAMVASRGKILPKLADTVLADKPVFTRPLAPDPLCGTVARPSQISAHYEDAPVQQLLPGDTTVLQGVDTTLALWVVHAEERVVLNPACAEGPDELGEDLEVVAVRAPSQP